MKTYVLKAGDKFYNCDDVNGDHLVDDQEDALIFSEKHKLEFEPVLQDKYFVLTDDKGRNYYQNDCQFVEV